MVAERVAAVDERRGGQPESAVAPGEFVVLAVETALVAASAAPTTTADES